jgi:hypothetical protein
VVGGETGASPRPLPLGEACQALSFELVNPILHRAGTITKEVRYLTARQSVRDEQNAVKSVVISRLTRTTNLVLKTKDDILGIRHREWLHEWIIVQTSRMRNYL